MGEVITESFGYGGGRKVSVYLPPESPEAIVYAGDGEMIASWGPFLESEDLPSTMRRAFAHPRVFSALRSGTLRRA